MMKYCIVIALIIQIDGLSIPNGYRYTYNYTGIFKAKSTSIESLSSEFKISAEIIFNKVNHTHIFMYLDDVKYASYVGDGNEIREEIQYLEYIEQTLRLPLLIINKNFKYSFRGHENDELWSVKMKKALSFIFNFDESILNDLEPCNSKRMKIYEDVGGERNPLVSYTAANDDNEYIITKEYSSFASRKPVVELNIAKFNCENPPVYGRVQRKYKVLKSNEGYYVWDMQSDSEDWLPFGEYYSATNQTVIVKSIEKIRSAWKIDDEYVEESLVRDVKIDPNMITTKVKESLQSIVDYIKTKKIDLSDALNSREQSLVEVIDYMKLMNFKSLSDLYYMKVSDDGIAVSKEARELFSEVLPFVGTSHAIKMTQHIILNDLSLNKYSKINILRNMFKMQQSKENVVDYLTNNDSGLNEEIRTTATFAFAAMLNNFNPEPSTNDQFGEYVSSFKSKLDESNDYKERFILINVLNNMITDNTITPIIENIVLGKESYSDFDSHLRAVAMLSGLQETRKKMFGKNGKTIEDVYLPVFQNKTEDLEVRLMALYVLMETSKSNTLIELYWHMLAEKSEEVRSLYYTYLKNHVESDKNCLKYRFNFFKSLSRAFPRFTEKKWSNSFMYDYTFLLEKMGYTATGVTFGDLSKHKFLTIYLKKSFNYNENAMDQESLYVNLRLKENNRNIDLDDIMQLDIYSFSIELILLDKDMITYAIFYDNLNEMMDEMRSNIFLTDWNVFNLKKHSNAWLDFNNDMGLPIKFHFSETTIQKTLFNVSNTMNMKMQPNLKFKQWNNIEYGVRMYNPIANVWHGIRRVQTVDISVGIKLIIDINPSIGQYQLEFELFPVKEQDNIGFQSVGHTEVFISGNNSEKILYQSCEKCSSAYTKKEYTQNITIWEIEDDNTGMIYSFRIFDCEKEDVIKHKSNFEQIFKEKMQKLNIKSIFITVMSLWHYIVLSPGQGTCGIGFNIRPSVKFPMTHIRVSYKIHNQFMSNDYELDIERFNNVTSMKSWNLKYESRISDTIEYKAKANLKRKYFGEYDMEICMETEQHFDDGVLYKKTHFFQNDSMQRCNRNKTILLIEMTGTEQQTNNSEIENRTYEDCILNSNYEFNSCVTKVTAMRGYDYKIKYAKFQNEILKNVFNKLKVMYEIESLAEKCNGDPDLENAHVWLSYPADKPEELVMIVKMPLEKFSIIGMRLDYNSRPYIMMPQSIFNYNNAVVMASCRVSVSDLTNVWDSSNNFVLSENWVLLFSEHKFSTNKLKIYAKKESDDRKIISLRVLTDEEELIYQMEGKIQIFSNGTRIETTSEIYQETESTKFRFLNKNRTILIHIKRTYMTIGFNGLTVRISTPHRGFIGLCA